MTEEDQEKLHQNHSVHHHHHHHRHHHFWRHRSKAWKTFWVLLGVLVAGLLVLVGVAWHNLSVTTGDMYSTSGANAKRNAQQVLKKKKQFPSY